MTAVGPAKRGGMEEPIDSPALIYQEGGRPNLTEAFS
jgi:hypothetical protein